MMHRNEGFVIRHRSGFGTTDSHKQRSDKTRPVCYRNGVNIAKRDAGFNQSRIRERGYRFGMRAACDLRYNAAV
jgi:hypothetical protein